MAGLCAHPEPATGSDDPLQAAQIARGWLRIASDDFPDPIVVCIDRSALEAAQAAARDLGSNGLPAPLFTPSEIHELARLVGLPDVVFPDDREGAAPQAPPITSSAAEPRGSLGAGADMPGVSVGERDDQQGSRGGGRPQPPAGRWNQLQLLRAVMASKRALGARIVPLDKAGGLAACRLEEDPSFVRDLRALIVERRGKAETGR